MFDMRKKKWHISNVLRKKTFGRKDDAIPFRLSCLIKLFTPQKCYTAPRGSPAFLPLQTAVSVKSLNKNRAVYM